MPRKSEGSSFASGRLLLHCALASGGRAPSRPACHGGGLPAGAPVLLAVPPGEEPAPQGPPPLGQAGWPAVGRRSAHGSCCSRTAPPRPGPCPAHGAPLGREAGPARSTRPPVPWRRGRPPRAEVCRRRLRSCPRGEPVDAARGLPRLTPCFPTQGISAPEVRWCSGRSCRQRARYVTIRGPVVGEQSATCCWRPDSHSPRGPWGRAL